MSKSLPFYFKDYLDERFKRVEENIIEIKKLIVEGDGSLIKKVERHEIWIKEVTIKMTLVVTILGSIFALVFTLVGDAVANILKLR